MLHRHCHGRRRGKRSTALPGWIERLELRVLLDGSVQMDIKQIEKATKLDDSLWHLYESMQASAQIANPAANQLQLDNQPRVAVTLDAADVKAASSALAAVGFEVTASFPSLHFADGLLPIASLGSVAQAGAGVGRFALCAADTPISLAGNVNSEADFVLEANRVRATMPAGFDGTGQRIGVLSDSYNHLGGASADVASGDLPSNVKVLQDYNIGGTDEGRAMLQVIHDLAPAASLAFATTAGGEGNFALNIGRMAFPGDGPLQGHANIVVDDTIYPREPMFQDGVIAQAIDDAVTTRGVSYFSAAGNFAAQAYESATFQTASDGFVDENGNPVSGTFYDFDPTAGTDTRQRITIPPGGKVVLSLQWDDPFYTESDVDTDLDFFLIDPATGMGVASSQDPSIDAQEPVEVITYQNPSSTTSLALDVAIRKYDGPDPGRIKYVNYGTPITFDEYATNSSALVPHATATNAEAVGAAAYFDQNHPEASTSTGPSTILFSPDGIPTTPEVRQAPQIASIDGVNNTFFGQDTDGDGKPNIFGTSAAAAHAAAVAALVRQANPSLTAAQIYSRLQATARDIGPTGFDNTSGFGVINAYRAVYPTIVPAALNFSDGLESGGLSSAYEAQATGSGRIIVTSDNGPFAGSKHLTLDSSIQSGVGLNEVTLHVNASGAGEKTLSFTEREFDDDDNPMPASFVGSSNSDGVALSVDGTNWYRIVSLTSTNSTSTYALQSFDLSAIAAQNGISLGADTRIRFQQYGTSRIPSDGLAFDDISVTSVVASAPPGTPDLLPENDSGNSDSDNLTNCDNSDSSKTMKFNVTATIAGATVTVYAEGTAVGSAVANGTSTVVTTSGLLDLSDGVHQLTARETEPGKSESADSSALAVTIDTVAPEIVRNGTTPGFLFDTSPHGLRFNFTENVQDTVQPQDVTVQRVASGSSPPQAVSFTYDPQTNGAIFVLGGTVSDGNFSAEINPSGVTDDAGNALAGDTSFDFFFLTGDANHDGHVNTLDFSALAQHFNAAATTFSQGNFNYDGSTNSMDFNVFACRFGAALTSPVLSNVYPGSQMAAPSVGSLFSDSPLDRSLLIDVDLPLAISL